MNKWDFSANLNASPGLQRNLELINKQTWGTTFPQTIDITTVALTKNAC